MNPAASPVAWEDESEPFPANLALTWWECLVAPGRFFRHVTWDGSFARPLLYFLVVGILAGTFGLFWFAWSPWGAAEYLGLTLELQLLSFFLTPFALLVVLAVIALAQHLFVVLMLPEHRGLGATATVLCYGSGVGLVKAFLPPALGFESTPPSALGSAYLVLYVMFLGAVLTWYLVVLVIGIRQAHSTTTGRATAIVLLPMAIGLVFSTILAVVVVALGMLADLPV